MAPPLNTARTAKRKPKRESDLTIMVVGKVGKIRSYKVSPRLLFWASLIMVLYLVISILIINDYFGKRWTNDTMSKRLKVLQHEVDTARRDLYRTRQHLTLLEDRIHPPKAIDEKIIIPGDHEKVEQKKVTPVLEDSLLERFERVTRETMVDVRDFSIRKEKTKINIAFNLINIQEDKTPVDGYLHMIAMNNQTAPPQSWTYPKVALKNGLPITYKQGQHFIIKRFKAIKGEFFLGSQSESPSSMKVLIYDQSGNLIFEKEFEVENAP